MRRKQHRLISAALVLALALGMISTPVFAEDVSQDESENAEAAVVDTESTVHEHSYTQTVIPPTCTEQGYTSYVCSCGESYNDDYVDALGHVAGEPGTEYQGDEGESELVSYCTVCGAELSREAQPIPEDSVLAEGSCGENSSWSLTEAGILSISGSGSVVTGSAVNSSPWYDYRDQITEVTVSGEITELGAFAFWGSSLERITFEEGSKLTVLGKYAFSACENLAEIKVPDGVSRIEYSTFKNCHALANVYLPDAVQFINETAFYGAENAVICANSGSHAINWAKAHDIQYDEAFSISSITCAISVENVTKEIILQNVAGEYWLFLPACADLHSISFRLPGNLDTIELSGDNGSCSLQNSEPIDLLDVAEFYDGEATIQFASEDDTLTVHVMHSEKLGAMFICSDDAVNYGRAYVDAVKGRGVTATMALLSADGSVVYNKGLSQIKSRGNSTFAYEKKPYQIKLKSKTDLLGTGEKVKTWVLLANYSDATLMHDKLFKDIALSAGLSNTANTNWVDLYYDGEYRGTYLLSEKVQVNSTSVDINDLEEAYSDINDGYGEDAVQMSAENSYGNLYTYVDGLTDPENITGGWLVELNATASDEICGFAVSQKYRTGSPYMFNVKSPEFASQQAMCYISEYMQAFEDAVYAQDEDGNYTGYNKETGKYYYDYCDKESLVKAYLIMEFCCNTDGFYKSTYFYKDADGILYAGPVWDGDLSFGTGWNRTIKSTDNLYSNAYLFGALMKIPDFFNSVASYFQSDFSYVLSKADGMIDEYYNSLSASEAMNHVLWPTYYKMGSSSLNSSMAWDEGTSYTDVVDHMSQWGDERIAYLNTEFTDRSGSCGDLAEWTLTADGTLTISGSGAVVTGNAVTSAPWYAYRSQIKNVVVGKDITELGAFSFWGCTALQEITFEEGSVLATLGKYAFSGCSNLQEVVVPKGVKRIEYATFKNCTALTYVYLPDTVSYIAAAAFTGASNVNVSVAADSYAAARLAALSVAYTERKTEISGTCGEAAEWTLADGILTISGSGAVVTGDAITSAPWYEYRTQVINVVVGKDITELGAFAFWGCTNLQGITFEEDSALAVLGKYAFSACGNLQEVVVPKGVKRIEYATFKNCTALTYVYLPDEVTYIDVAAFTGASIVNVSVAADSYAAARLAALSVTYTERKTEISGTCGEAAEWTLADGTLTISGSGAVVTGNAVTSAPWYTYRNQIKNVVVGKDITELGAFSFWGCTALQEITFEEGSVLATLGKYAFSGCSNLQEVVVPKGVKRIEYATFKNCAALTYVYLPDEVTYIDVAAFTGASNANISVAAGSYAARRLEELGVRYIAR